VKEGKKGAVAKAAGAVIDANIKRRENVGRKKGIPWLERKIG